MTWESEEVRETLRMIENECLDIRTVTMGISLLDVRGGNTAEDLGAGIRGKILAYAGRLREVVREVEGRLGVPIVNVRIAVTPLSLVAGNFSHSNMVYLAHVLDDVAQSLDVDYLGGFGALVHKGFAGADKKLIEAIPEAIGSTQRVCSAVNVASTRAGINMDAVALMGEVILGLAKATADKGGIGCAKLVAFANAVDDNPFIAGAFHGIGEPECSINVGVSGPGVVLSAIKRLRQMDVSPSLGVMAETIKRMAFKITRAGEVVGREVARRLGPPARFGIVDLSLAPTPAVGDSVANIIEAMGIERVGAPGTTAALALLTDAVKKGGAMASSYVGGLSGAFIPVSEDRGMVEAVECGALTLHKLEAMTSVCSVGLDMIAIPGDTPAESIAALIADEAAIGVVNNKTTAVRVIPVPGMGEGDKVVFGGLLGEAPIMSLGPFRSTAFVRMGGRIPAPLHSLKN